jgi:hypothetical protein
MIRIGAHRQMALFVVKRKKGVPLLRSRAWALLVKLKKKVCAQARAAGGCAAKT